LVDLETVLSGGESRQSQAFKWDDGPVAFTVRGIGSPLIALTLAYHAGPTSICENTAQVLIFRRDAANEVLELLARLSKSDNAIIVSHRDYMEFKKGFRRLHIPLRTNDRCMNSEAALVYHMNVGNIYFLDGREAHAGGSLASGERAYISSWTSIRISMSLISLWSPNVI
jgi:hypothetical protein